MDKKFTVAEQYRLFLQRVALPEDKMHPIQKRQIKQAFYAAWGQCLIHTRDEVSDLPEDDAIQVLVAQQNEIADFFLAQTNQSN